MVEQDAFRTAPHIADPADARALRAILLDRVARTVLGRVAAVFDADPDVSAEPFTWPGDALAHPQLLHTGDSVEVDDPTLGRTRQLGPLFTRPRAPRRERRRAAGIAASLLQGVTVLELANWIATPMASALLTELGARVIKIEPLDGDLLRGYGPVGLKCVQGTQSITLDLKTTEGLAIVHRLVERADALVHNYRPGVPERLGIDDATLRALNPGLIYLYAASYGSTGPMAARPAFHVTAGAVCGGALAQSAATAHPVPTSSSPTRSWRLVAAPHALQRGQPRLQRRARRRGRGDHGVVRAFANRRGPDDGDPDDGVERVRVVGALHRLPGSAAAGHARRRCARTARALPPLSGPGRLGLPRRARRPRLRPALRSARATRAREDARFNTGVARGGTRRRARPGARRELRARARGGLGTGSSLRRGVACVQAYDGSHAAYIFDAPWAEKLGLVEEVVAAGRVRTAATAASCAPNATSARSVRPISPARRPAASSPSSATPTTRLR